MLVPIITQFADHVKISLTLQLIKGISRVFQKSLKYFNGTIISTSIIPTSLDWPVTLVLKLNESVKVALVALKSTIAPSLFTTDISLQYCYKLPDVFE